MSAVDTVVGPAGCSVNEPPLAPPGEQAPVVVFTLLPENGGERIVYVRWSVTMHPVCYDGRIAFPCAAAAALACQVHMCKDYRAADQCVSSV